MSVKDDCHPTDPRETVIELWEECNGAGEAVFFTYRMGDNDLPFGDIHYGNVDDYERFEIERGRTVRRVDHRDQPRRLRAQREFVRKYIADRGWDYNNLSSEQVQEISDQETYKSLSEKTS